MRTPHTYDSWTDERKEAWRIAWLEAKREKRKNYDAKPERKAAASKRSKSYYANNKEKCKALSEARRKKKRRENEEEGLIKFKPGRDLSPLEAHIRINYKARMRRKNRSEESKEEDKRKRKEAGKKYYNLLRIKREEDLSRNPRICKNCRKPYTARRWFYCSIECSKIAKRQRDTIRIANNPELKKKYALAYKKRNPNRSKEQSKKQRSKISDYYIADLMGIQTAELKKSPELMQAKREQIKILRTLKQETKKQNAPES